MSEKNFLIEKITELPDSGVEISCVINESFLATCRKQALKKLNEHINLPGFRKGFVPEDILVKTIGESHLLEETAEIAMSKEYSNIIVDSKAKPIARPEIKILNLKPNAPLTFLINLVVEPKFELPDYKKIAAEVKDDDIEKKRMQILENILKETKLELPKKFVDSEAAHTLDHFQHDVEKAGIKWNEYLEKVKKTEDEIKDSFKEQIAQRAKAELIINKIAEAEGLKTYGEVFKFLEQTN